MGDKSPKKEQKEKEKSQPRSGKGFTYEVVLLDGEHVNIELDKNAQGNDLFEKVCQHLDLIEKEYFGLQYVDERIPSPLKCWLSPDKKVSKQKKRGPWLFDFALKFYPPDPTQLRESLTRWLVTLQTRRDILSGKLPATFLTQAMLGSYCVQADIGDYDSNEHHGTDYVRDIPFTPNQTKELLEKVVELHRQHKGQTPDEAEINYLENSKKLSMYGVDLHAAQDVNNVSIMIGVCASGLQVYRDKLRISRFVWPKILKISYKRNHFYIKVRPHDNSRLENTVSFKLASHRLAKRLWKICVEHHAFFRLREAEQPHNAAMFPRLGSKFRYSGRTLYQARHSSQTLDRPDPYFERREPARNTYSAPTNRSRSVDELTTNRPDYWKDDLDAPVKRRPSDTRGEGRDRKDHMGQPTVISMLGLPEGMKPVENEPGRELEPGANRSRDGRDRQDLRPGEEDTTLERDDEPSTMGLTPSELLKKAKEDEKERKKREKEEEKKRKKEEEDKKKAAKKGKGKGDTDPTDPTAEDRTDIMGGGDATEKAPRRTSGSYADQEGGPIRFGVVAPVGSAPGDKDKDRDRDGRSPGHDTGDRDRLSPSKDGSAPYGDQWEPGTAPDDVEMRERIAPRRGNPEDEGDRFSSFKKPEGNDRWSFEKPKSGQDSQSPGKDKDGRSPGGRDGDDRDPRFAYPGKDKDGRSPGGRDGDDRDPRFAYPGKDKDGRSPGGRDGDDRDPRFAYPGKDKDGRSPGGRDGDDRDPRFAYPGKDKEGRSPGGRDGDDRDPRFAYPGKDKDGRSPGGRDGDDRDPRFAYPGKDKDGRSPGGRNRDDRDPRFAYPGKDKDGRSPGGRDGEGWGPGQDDRGPFSPGREGDRASWEPGREVRGPYAPYGERDGRGPGEDGDRDRDGQSPGAGSYRDLPPGTEDRRHYKPGETPTETDRDRWGPGGVPLDFDRKDRKYFDKDDDKDKEDHKDSDEDDDKDPKKKKHRKGSDKDKKKGRKDSDKDKKKDRKDSDKDDKDAKKDKKKGKKDKDRKGSDKDDEKDKKRKDSDKENEKDKKKDKDGDKPIKEEKKGGLFSKFKKPKESKDDKSKHPDDKSKHPDDDKSKHPEDEDRSPGHGKDRYPGYGDDDRHPGYGKDGHPRKGDDRYPGYGDDDRHPGYGKDGHPRKGDDRSPGYGDDDRHPGYGKDGHPRKGDDRYPGYGDDDRHPGYGKDGHPRKGDDRSPGYGDDDRHPGYGKDGHPRKGDDRSPGYGDDDRHPGYGKDGHPGKGDDRSPGYGDDDRHPGYGKDDSRPGYGRGYGPGEQEPGRRGYPDSADAGRNKEARKASLSSDEGVFDPTRRASRVSSSDQGAAPYPGLKPGHMAPVGSSAPGGPRFAPGMGVGSGDMSGVVGDETFVDNKLSFQPVVPPKQESRNSLRNPRLSDIDHTMPFFSPAATSTVGRPRSGKVPPPISPKPNNSFDDSFSRRDPPTVATESVQYQPDLEEVPVPTKNVPLVKTETRTVTYEREGFPLDGEDGVLVSARSHSTRMQTIDTTTYKTEKDGVQETRVEHRVVLSSTDDDFDYDAALAEAIRSVTEFNPDMSVERIECVQQIEEVKDK